MPSIGVPLEASALPSGTPGTKSGSGKLAPAAVEFEPALLGLWRGSAEKSFATVPGSEEDEDAGGEQMLSFAMQQLAHGIAAKGGLGIARIVQGGLEHAAASGNSPAPPPSGAALSASPAKLLAAP